MAGNLAKQTGNYVPTVMQECANFCLNSIHITKRAEAPGTQQRPWGRASGVANAGPSRRRIRFIAYLGLQDRPIVGRIIGTPKKVPLVLGNAQLEATQACRSLTSTGAQTVQFLSCSISTAWAAGRHGLCQALALDT